MSWLPRPPEPEEPQDSPMREAMTEGEELRKKLDAGEISVTEFELRKQEIFQRHGI